MSPSPYIVEDRYDTDINIIGSIKEINHIVFLIKVMLFPNFTKEEFINNELGARASKSVSRIQNGVESAFLSFRGEEHEAFFTKLLSKDIPQTDIYFILYWQFLVNNLLFREITSELFIKYYFAGRAYLDKDDVLGFIKELKSKNISISWSESTLEVIASKYLNLMTKFGFLEKEGKKRVFKYISLSPELQVLSLCFATFYPSGDTNSLSNDLVKMSFIPQDDLVYKYKKLSMNGMFNMSFSGNVLKVDFNDSFERVIDVLYK